MTKVFHIQPEWVEGIPFQRSKRRIRDAIFTILLIPLSWFINIWVFSAVFMVAILYWLADIRAPDKSEIAHFWPEVYVEVRDDGLFQYLPELSGSSELSLLTPWHVLELSSVKQRNGTVQNIRLIDQSLPKGARIINLAHYNDMERLLTQIKQRVRNGT